MQKIKQRSRPDSVQIKNTPDSHYWGLYKYIKSISLWHHWPQVTSHVSCYLQAKLFISKVKIERSKQKSPNILEKNICKEFKDTSLKSSSTTPGTPLKPGTEYPRSPTRRGSRCCWGTGTLHKVPLEPHWETLKLRKEGLNSLDLWNSLELLKLINSEFSSVPFNNQLSLTLQNFI